jgi:ribonuclease D
VPEPNPSHARPKAPAELAPPELVEDRAGLERLMAVLESEREIAVDTEADSFYHYQERVCLVQISAGGRDWLVDPLRGLDIRPLGALLSDPARTKVFHDGEYDVLILKRQFGFRFAGLFDTRVAAAALGMEAPGLAAVVNAHYGFELDKSQQRSDWSRRPLSREQVAYARLDTHYLVPLMHALAPELERRGRMPVLAGECARLAALEPAEKSFHADEFLRLKGARRLSLLEMRVLRELFVLREEHARARDLPPFKILAPQALIELAQARPTSPRALDRLVPPSIQRRLGTEILAAIQRGLAQGPFERVPSLPARGDEADLDEAGVELHERLKQWRKERAQKEGLDSSLVLNRRVLLRLAETRPRTREDLAGIDGLLAWQLELFGNELLAVVQRFERDLAAGAIELRRRRRS